ncbi:MOSC domain-containing protein [Rubrimonas cliftonensis]|uniref:MOSC domain-containing protein n=2 Tax=Rubrimonas cliftonensis TaxID=89524 RepID=A0A1H4APL2_9RHOB|nr:MOSC domain-containing protein [Rubrimonas cliftonensis]SEA37835.1 MOSC domain-containing protein [Rubrimonas cliftonensis]
MAARWARPGRVAWLGVRPARRAPVVAVAVAEIGPAGLAGDRREAPGRRAVTLIQAEHLPVIAALAGRGAAPPEALRRNVVVAGVNLLGLRARRFRLGTAVLEGAGLCAPCSRMEEALGPGGYAAVRGHGGICASVVSPGVLRLGDALVPLD